MKKRTNICQDCGELTNRQLAVRCRACHLKKITHPDKFCVDCGTQIDKRAIRCSPCRLKNKDLHPRWQGGLPKCLDCGKQLTQYDAKRCHSCSRKGELNYQWYKDRTFVPYPTIWSVSLRERIRVRDNNICQLCKISQEEHSVHSNQLLSVHHIDYDKNNCDSSNLITLCTSCHVKTNHNREIWKEYFTKVMLQKAIENAK